MKKAFVISVAAFIAIAVSSSTKAKAEDNASGVAHIIGPAPVPPSAAPPENAYYHRRHYHRHETQSEIAACNTKRTPHKLKHQMSRVLY